ncbi:hypothetical protein SAPIO_CDS9836 [Scedosporium apiospermum]|uniref:Major facilitator superfamily (MFS) profile domain-containing protein n=1 Tax=Pseudallescheria apiosperma TaxID=563466 RepID=A0A084FVR7_PSEDA|nr:uncharacterized protein SAPIO_CDS9836 [Scedosporium apiospermum]KEZ39179.1 hypothetical protein SAPIO_CDS9836 [Scedosporium apiospermum]
MSLGRWRVEDRVRIQNPLSSLNDEQVNIDATRFVNSKARFLSDRVEEVQRAAHVAKHIRFYEQIARGYNPGGASPPVILTDDEKRALVREKEKIISEHGMWYVFVTVALAAFLQGFVQSSFAGANVYEGYWRRITDDNKRDHEMGITNGIAYLAAALIGCPLSDPINQIAGRRGAIFFASILIMTTSIAAASLSNFDEDGTAQSTAWKTLVGLRLINGIGMGIKAVSTPILASETAIGYWRGSALLVWQLWVALGIFVSNSFNLLFYLSPRPIVSLRLILASPMVPAIFLAISLIFTPESPRFYLRPQRGHYNPEKAYRELKRLRNTELQALRDLYLVHRSVEFSDFDDRLDERVDTPEITLRPKLSVRIRQYFSRYRDLIANPRLRNSTISSCTVAFGQQLCGINIFAFYATTLFLKVLGGIKYDGNEDDNREAWKRAMLYSFGFGLTNFLFGIPAIGTIDTFGRRRWLLVTIPGMAFALLAAALSLENPDPNTRTTLVVIFMLIHTVFYSPAMGPVPFTLASEAFPLSHREHGCSVAITTNLFFAGLLAWFYPLLDSALGGHRNSSGNPRGGGGALGLFAGFNVLAFVLVYLLVEETKQRDLEDLDQIYAVSKRKFAKFQATVHLPWFFRRVFTCSTDPKPDFYDDTTNTVIAPDVGARGDISPPGSPIPGAGSEDKGPIATVTDTRPGSGGRYA